MNHDSNPETPILPYEQRRQWASASAPAEAFDRQVHKILTLVLFANWCAVVKGSVGRPSTVISHLTDVDVI